MRLSIGEALGRSDAPADAPRVGAPVVAHCDVEALAGHLSDDALMVGSGFELMEGNKDAFNLQLGRALRLIARKRGIAVGELCRVSRISRATISRYFKGETSISLYHFIVMCRALDCSPSSVCAWCARRLSEESGAGGGVI